MSGGSQHNPNGRQSQLGPGWSPLQVANFLARAPQVHMPTDRGVTWHTPTPPPHLYHVPAPSPPDPLQAMKSAGSNSVYRHTGTPPELYRHTPTPPDKHLMSSRHTPSPGDVKGAPMPQSELYPHLGSGREKLRPEELLAYARVGVDLSLGGSRAANGSPAPPALSVRDAPTINSLIAASARQPLRHHHARVDALLERLVPSPAPHPAPAAAAAHSVIVHPRAAPTPSPPSSNEDSADSCGAPPGSKRKRKPERTLRVPAVPPPLQPPDAPAPAPAPVPAPAHATSQTRPPAVTTHSAHAQLAAAVAAYATPPHAAHAAPPPPDPPEPAPEPEPETHPHPHEAPKPVENGDTPHAKANGPEKCPSPPPPQPPPARRKTRSGSAETIADIAAMVADQTPAPPPPVCEPTVSVDTLKSVLASPEPKKEERESRQSPVPDAPALPEKAEASPPPAEPAATSPPAPAPTATSPVAAASTASPAAAAVGAAATSPGAEAPAAAAPRRRSARTDHSESANVPVDSPSEAKPAEPETSEAPTAEPTAASFVEVENQLEKMFAGIEEEPAAADAEPGAAHAQLAKAKKRRKSAPTKGERKAARVSSRASTDEAGVRRKAARKKDAAKAKRKDAAKDAYDSGSNASSSRSRGPYIQIRGPCESPVSVSVVNARGEAGGEEEGEAPGGRRRREVFRNGLRARGLHASTLGLRYDATTPDATWLCVFCERGPHAAGLGDLFGPYSIDLDSDDDRTTDEATRRHPGAGGAEGGTEVWLHEACGVWAPGVVAAGARVWGLAAAVRAARRARCAHCARPPAALACAARACPARAHLPCASRAHWRLAADEFRAFCPTHASAAGDEPDH